MPNANRYYSTLAIRKLHDLVLGGETTGISLTNLDDVTITTPISGHAIRHNGTKWVNAVFAHSDLSGIGTNTHAQIDTHLASVSNPHGVTLAQTNLALIGTFDISNTAPAITLTDTTTSAKSLKIDVDGNMAQIREKTGASNSLITIDLVNNRVGIGVAAPNYNLEAAGNDASTTLGGTAGQTIVGVRNTDTTNDNFGLITFYSGTTQSGRCSIGAQYRDHSLSTGDLIFVTNNAGSYTTKMTISANGNVGIGTVAPNTTALLDLTSTTKGALMPRMTTTQRDAISTPATGLYIYNTSTNKFNFYNGSAWEAITSS